MGWFERIFGPQIGSQPEQVGEPRDETTKWDSARPSHRGRWRSSPGWPLGGPAPSGSDGGDPGGVREPRRPAPSAGAAGAEPPAGHQND